MSFEYFCHIHWTKIILVITIINDDIMITIRMKTKENNTTMRQWRVMCKSIARPLCIPKSFLISDLENYSYAHTYPCIIYLYRLGDQVSGFMRIFPILQVRRVYKLVPKHFRKLLVLY